MFTSQLVPALLEKRLLRLLQQFAAGELTLDKSALCMCTTSLRKLQRLLQQFAAGELTEPLDKASTAYSMEISTEKTKLMANNTSGINTEIKVNGQKLETITSFKYLGSVMRVPSLRYPPG